ncbi:MAG: FkbM family methyltransferase [Pseudomonadota bacterium]
MTTAAPRMRQRAPSAGATPSDAGVPRQRSGFDDLVRRARKLTDQPAFRADPISVLTRAAHLGAAHLLGRNPSFRLTSSGRERLRAPADLRYTTITAFLLRDWVEPELRALDRLLSPRDVFLDVGANIGLYSLKAARLVGPTGRVLALEPGAEAYDHLVANLAMNAFPWAAPMKVAASDAAGEAVLHHVPLGHDPQAFSLIANARATDGEVVETVTLDSLIDRAGLTRVDLIKIDVEGAEPIVIAGARDMLARLRPAVIFECNAHINAGGETGAAGEAWTMLSSAGYCFFRLIGDAFTAIDTPPVAFCNVIAVHADRRPPFAS